MSSALGNAFHRFGPYLILRNSGVGGMGRIELALRANRDDGEPCVLKRMHRDGEASTAEQRDRFRREAKIAAGLMHRNIAETLRIDDVAGELCLAQELVEGVNLGRLERRCGSRRIPIAIAVHIAREIAAALAYAHAFGGLGIVHRDVAPENVMLSFDGDVKLVDFGIAKSEVDGALTNVGMIVGRCSYVAPEAWSGAKDGGKDRAKHQPKIDGRADVYALGVVWEMLTGRRLEEMPAATVQGGVPDPRSVRSGIPPELAAVVMSALAADPAERYQTAELFASALGRFVVARSAPRAELAALLGLWFNVPQARQMLAEDVAEARRLLRVARAGGKPRARLRRSLWVATAVAAGAILIGVTASTARSRLVASPQGCGGVASR